MYFIAFIALIASLSCASPTTSSKTFVATFDDIPGNGLTPQLTPVKAPYKGLAFSGFNAANTSQAPEDFVPQSAPNVASSFTLLQILQGSTAMITTRGTTTKAFDLQSTYNACVVSSQAGLVAEKCTIQYTGVKTSGAVVSGSCTFTPAVPVSLRNKLAPCSLPSGFTGLTSVSLFPVSTGTLPATTIIILDTVTGVIYLGRWRFAGGSIVSGGFGLAILC